jgi:hypothetical protein
MHENLCVWKRKCIKQTTKIVSLYCIGTAPLTGEMEGRA